MFKQASLKAFTSDFDVCDKDLGIDSVSGSFLSFPSSSDIKFHLI